MAKKSRARAVRRGASIGAAVGAFVPLPGARLVGAGVGALVGLLASTPADRERRTVSRGMPSPVLLSEDDVQQAVLALREAHAAGQTPAEAVRAPPVVRLLAVQRVSPRPAALAAYVVGLRSHLAAAVKAGQW